MDLTELEFENMYLEGKNITLRLDTNLLMLDKVLNMYDYASRYGIDKSFVKVYNINAELDAVTGFNIAGNESFDYTDVDPVYKQACMEGIVEGIKATVKWIIEKIKQLLNWIKNVWLKFIRMFDADKTNHEINKLKQTPVKEEAQQYQFSIEMADRDSVNKACEAARALEDAIKYVDSNITDDAVKAIEESLRNYKKTSFFRNWSNKPREIMFRLGDKDRYLDTMQKDMTDLATVYVVIQRLMSRATEGLKIMKKSAEVLSSPVTSPDHMPHMDTVKLLKIKIKHTTELIEACNKVTKYILQHQRITDSALNDIRKALYNGKDDIKVAWKYKD